VAPSGRRPLNPPTRDRPELPSPDLQRSVPILRHAELLAEGKIALGLRPPSGKGRVGCRGDSGCQRRFLQGDGVPEALELSDEASGFGVRGHGVGSNRRRGLGTARRWACFAQADAPVAHDRTLAVTQESPMARHRRPGDNPGAGLFDLQVDLKQDQRP
jgi:hypothetical protein